MFPNRGQLANIDAQLMLINETLVGIGEDEAGYKIYTRSLDIPCWNMYRCEPQPDNVVILHKVPLEIDK